MKDSEAMCHWKRAAHKNNYAVVYRLQHPTVSFGNLKLKWTIYCTRQCCARVQVLNDISHVFQIFSRVIMSNGLNQPLPQEGFELDDQLLKAQKWPWGLTANVATIAGRIRHIHLLRVPLSTTVPSSMPYFLMTLRSWSMSNSSVASLPADMGRKPRNWQPENRKPKSWRIHTNPIPTQSLRIAPANIIMDFFPPGCSPCAHRAMWQHKDSYKNT